MSPILETEISCPHCGDLYTTLIDTTQGDHSTIEDCPVCCRPIQMRVRCEPGVLNAVEALAD